jgi:hypothetical protein
MEYRSLEHKIRDLWIAEANRNTEMRRKVANVGRPEDNVKDETSKLAKQGEIKKIIDEAADGDIGKVAADKKKPKDKDDSDKSSDKAAKKDTDMDDMEAKTIKGGKTEVITDHKTDDSTENSTDENQKSKKATNQENKKIGAKGVKEETMTGKLTFGSSQSLIDSIAEAMKSMKGICPKCKKAKCMCEGWKEETELEEKLVGGQKKLDKNHNGKLDKQDFKMIRKEEVVDEERMSKGRRDALARKTSFTADPPRRLEKPEPKETKSDKMKAYRADRDKHMEEEAIDEVLDTPMKKLGYIAKNAYQVATADPAKMANDPKKANAIANRVIGAKRFQKKLNKEEVEQVYEEEGYHIKDYDKKSASQHMKPEWHHAIKKAGYKTPHKAKDHYGIYANHKSKPKLEYGIHPKTGEHRVHVGGKSYHSPSDFSKDHGTHNEEVEFSEAEIARIEEIAASIDEVVTARKLTAADKAARAKYLEGHKAKMAGMAHHAIKGDAKSFKDRNTETGDYTKEPSKMAGIGLDHTLTKQDTKVSK